MMDMENLPSGLYQRGDTWWVRIRADGQYIRRSTKTRDLPKALIYREELISKVHSRFIENEWRRHVQEHLSDSNSWLRRTLRRIKTRSAAKGWPEVMTKAEFIQLMINSGGDCAITGLPFERKVAPSRTRNAYAISIDRIDSSLGYTSANCRLVLLAVNLGMCQWGESDFRSIARAMVGKELLGSAVNITKKAQPNNTPNHRESQNA
jgi:hypothetical protein